MPRIGITELTSVNPDDLEKELAKAEWLLHGNMDGDNLLWSGINKITIPQGKIQDSPFNGNPTYGEKFFSYIGSGGFYEDVWQEVYAMILANPMYTLAVAETSFTFTPVDDGSSSFPTFTRKAIVKKPANHKLLYLNSDYGSGGEPFSVVPIYRDHWATTEYENASCPAVIPMMTSSFSFDTSLKGVDFSIFLDDNMEETVFTINWNVSNLDTDEYLYAGFRFICFYKVLL